MGGQITIWPKFIVYVELAIQFVAFVTQHGAYMIGVLLASLLFIAATAHAVPYSLPTSNGGWYQLQHPDTFETLCFTGSPQPCDVPAGMYILINHKIPNGLSGHRTSVNVGPDSEEPMFPKRSVREIK